MSGIGQKSLIPRVHPVRSVKPEKMSNVTLGQTIVMTFREALALTLEPVEAAAAE